jgi:pimeloyl-ACP methyl ester carboxylesterase
MDPSLLGAMATVAAALAFGTPLAAYVLQDKLIFQQRPLAEAEHQAVAQRHPEAADIFLQSEDGVRLHAWHVQGAPEAPLVLYFGGNAEEVSWMLDQLRSRGDDAAARAAWLLVDYRGYGASEGAPSEQALTADALAWYDRFAGSSTRVYAFGRSLGSGVAVQLAAARRLDGVILVAPFDSLVQVGKHHYPLLPVGLLLRHRFDSLGRAPSITAPLLCIAAAHDEVIPPQHARRLFEAWAGAKRWVEVPGRHNEMDLQPDFWPSIGAFLTAR